MTSSSLFRSNSSRIGKCLQGDQTVGSANESAGRHKSVPKESPPSINESMTLEDMKRNALTHSSSVLPDGVDYRLDT